MGEKMRLDKLLALLGEGTRSEIKAMVRAGRVTVDGAGARDAGMQVDGAQSDVRLDGRRLCYKAVRHVMLNKPSGVLTAARRVSDYDAGGRARPRPSTGCSRRCM